MFVLADNNPTRHIAAPFVNWAIMAACTLIFVIGVPWQDFAFTPAYLHLIGGPKAPGGAAQVIGQMVSYCFFHATWLHLAGNMLALWVFGDNIEDSMGHPRYVLFFVLCGMAGAGTESLFTADPGVPVIGASGAIAGVMGAYLLLHPRARVLVLIALKLPLLVPAAVFAGFWLALNVASALADPQPGVTVAFWTHIGGFAAGAALIPLLRRRDVPLFQPLAPYPDRAFFGLSRWLPDVGHDTFGGSALWFWIKAAVFFILVVILMETVLS